LHATGLNRKSLKRPFIGVASSFTDLIPGHIGMRDIERFVERGICYSGGVPFISEYLEYATVLPWGIWVCVIPLPRAS